jgi:NADH-quinone oxidoreductase subunit J
MPVSDVVFGALAVIGVAAGAGVFVVASMARATWLLLNSFLAVAGVLILLAGQFLGVVLILMIFGEMTIMALFMLTLMGMNGAGLMKMSMVHNRRGSTTIAVAAFAVLATGILTTPWRQQPAPRPADDTHALGLALMGPNMLVMMLFGVGLFTTIIAGVLLATHRGRYDRYGDDLTAREPRDPIAGGL